MSELTSRLRIVAIGMIKEAGEDETKENINRMLDFVIHHYNRSSELEKALMREGFDKGGI